MLRLRSCNLTHLVSSPSSTYPISPLHRLLTTSAPPIPVPANPAFAVEEYLVETCGLTRAQALKASPKLCHLKSRTKPDAVLAFLTGLGLSGADVAALVAKDPSFLCVKVEKTLSPIVAGLSGHGLSHAEIARVFSLGRNTFRCRSVVSNLPYYMSLFGSFENRVQFLKKSYRLLGSSLEKVVKPNVAFLRDCGLPNCDISKLCLSAPLVLTISPERLAVIVARAEGYGVPRGSAMFRHALHALASLSEEKLAAQVENLKTMFRWSDAEVHIAISKLPFVLNRSSGMLQRLSAFLISEVGLEPAYIAHRPVMLCYSLEGRLRPRYYVLKFLKENGLLDHDRDYYAAVMRTEKIFLVKHIHPYKETAPHLAEDYVATCKGEVPARFKFA